MPSPEAASALAAILHSNQSQPPSPAINPPQSNGPPKRALDTEDDRTYKKRRLEPSSASTSADSEEPLTPCQASQDKQVQAPQSEGDVGRVNEPSGQGFNRDKLLEAHSYSRDHGRETQEITQESDHSIRQDSRGYLLDDGHHKSEDKRPQPSNTPLSKANLTLFQQEVAAFEEMDNESTSSSQVRKRRAPSRQTSNSDLVSATSGRTKEPTPSQSFYRYTTLALANVYIRPEPLSETVQARLASIFERRVTDDRRRKISNIAKELSPQFGKVLMSPCREDDLVELVLEALLAMHADESLTYRRKADWNPDLKPAIQYQQDWDFAFLGQENPGDVTESSGKLLQTSRPFPSPVTSHATMGPPAAPQFAITAQDSISQDGTVKTPRPDFTMGFSHSTITHALMELGLSERRASTFLIALQREQKLCSDPTIHSSHSSDMRFPMIVIEGKAYATGKTIFEAENQAAVSGSSMLKVQQQLMFSTSRAADLDSTVEKATERSPFAFSLCTQGPILELWVHHIVTDGATPGYHMNLIAACHASLYDDLANFLLKVDRLLVWYKQDYLKEIADHLFAIASHAAR